MELRIYIRHTQYIAFEQDPVNGLQPGDPIIYTGLNTATLKPVPGTVPIKTWQDVTDCVANIDQLSLTWTVERDNMGNLTSSKFNKPKSASGTLQFEDRAYTIIKEWIQQHIAAPLNAIDVKIEHVGCGVYSDLIIKPTQIEWCEDGTCLYDVTLQQKDESYHCIQKTLIDDNWQGWFHKHTTKKHPRFLYCNEGRPVGMLVGLWYISTILFLFMLQLTPVIWIIQGVVALIIEIVNVIIGLINGVIWFFGGNKIKKLNGGFGSTNFFNPVAIMKSFYVESSGCGFNHPAPLIRDFIQNVCDKCGVKVDSITAPIFFSQTLNIDTSAEREQGVKNRANPYYNACYLPPSIKRGYRRFKKLFGRDLNPVYYWNEGNDLLMSLEKFLDHIKGTFNAEWRLQSDANGQQTLYFWRKDWFTNGKILYDFTKEVDRNKILKGMCFSWNENEMPAYMSGLYADDAQDSAGNQAKRFMNDMVSIGSKTNNALFKGEYSKIQPLGATKFRQDGVSEDYLMDAVAMLYNASLTAPLIVDTITNLVISKVLKEFDYALLLSDDFNSLGKIIIWDETSGYDNAFSVRNVAAGYTKDQNGNIVLNSNFKEPPKPNPVYNPDQKQFDEINEVNVNVKGFWGATVPGSNSYENQKDTVQARLVNYPMYFSSKFKDNLYDWFHWIDDPNIKPSMNMNWDCQIGLCCEDLKKLGVFDGANRLQLLERVKVPNGYYSDGILTEITVNYDSSDDYGKNIKLKGTV